ncbi:hypothetical protein [Vibrio alginolyticus]|uniref:hypothetical protein n=1 Tax=Vibrio alginolyticus TaxID=663 RepID=UPI003753F0D6
MTENKNINKLVFAMFILLSCSVRADVKFGDWTVNDQGIAFTKASTHNGIASALLYDAISPYLYVVNAKGSCDREGEIPSTMIVEGKAVRATINSKTISDNQGYMCGKYIYPSSDKGKEYMNRLFVENHTMTINGKTFSLNGSSAAKRYVDKMLKKAL